MFSEKNKVKSEEPTVKGINPKKPIPIKKTNSLANIIKSIKNIIFGNTDKQEIQRKRTKNYNPNYKGKKFNKNYKPRNNRYSRGKNFNNTNKNSSNSNNTSATKKDSVSK